MSGSGQADGIRIHSKKTHKNIQSSSWIPAQLIRSSSHVSLQWTVVRVTEAWLSGRRQRLFGYYSPTPPFRVVTIKQ